MGVGYSRQEFQQPNLIMDFEFQMFKPNATPRVYTKRGPVSNEMPPDIADEIYLTIENIIRNGDTYNAALYTRYYWSLCCCMIFSLPCWMILPVAIVYGVIFVIALNYFSEYRSYSYLAIGGCIILICVQCYCYCCSTKGVNRAAINWRNNVIQKINQKTQEWQSQWPQFSMTIIYPVTTTGRKGRTIMIKGIVRVTKGAPQIVDSAPLYSQYIQQVPQSELVVLNPQQHQRAATPVLLQGANGQQMVVQGKKAIINGREVLVVEQPQQQQQFVNHVVQYPHALPPQQIPVSTHSDIPAYNQEVNNDVELASAPPAYNPMVNRPFAGSRVEGNNHTVV